MASGLLEVWDQHDDWTGVASQAERRKRQNRLHQRAYRKKRHLARLALALKKPSQSDTPGRPGRDELSSVHARQQRELTPATVGDLPLFHILRCAGIREEVMGFMQRAFADWSSNLPRPRDLPALTRLNAFDALARNALILGIPVECLESDDGYSLFTLQGPRPLDESLPQTFPAHLSPTRLQRTVKHHPWLDLFPIPGMRNNILRGIQAGEIDEDQVCDALVCDFLNLEAGSTASLVIWGDSWEMDHWEFSPDFFKKWGVLLKGCPEVLSATNHWRAKRGESRVEELAV